MRRVLLLLLSVVASLVGALVDTSTINGLYQGSFSLIPYDNSTRSCQPGAPVTCPATVSLFDGVFTIVTVCGEASFVTGKVQSYADGKLTVNTNTGTLCYSWATTGPSATIVGDVLSTTCPPSISTPSCKENGTNSFYVLSLSAVDISDLQGTWNGTETVYLEGSNRTCVNKQCASSVTVSGTTLVFNASCANENPNSYTWDLYNKSVSQLNVYNAKLELMCLTWAQNGTKATMVLDTAARGACTYATSSCSNFGVKTFDLACIGGCKNSKNTVTGGFTLIEKIGAGIGALVVIALVVFIVWIFKKRHENSKRGSGRTDF